MTHHEFTDEFESCRGQLKSYILRMTASVQDTEDIVQNTWIKGSEKLDTFQGKSSIKTWIFAIASNLTKDNLRAQKRWTQNVTDICKEAAMANPAFFQVAMDVRMNSPQGDFEIKEHIAFCFTCIAKSLPLEQQLCLLLKSIYDFKISEISIILDRSVAMIKYYLHTAKAKMKEIFDGRCALINQHGTCHQCTELNGLFNPKQNAAEAMGKIEMVKAAQKSDKEHLFKLRMDVLKGIDPFESGAAELQLLHLEHNRKVMENYLKKK